MVRRLWRHREGTTEETPGPGDTIEVENETDPLPEQVYHDAARHYLDVQISAFDVLDLRAGQIFSVGSVALPLTFALLNLGSNRVDIPAYAVWSLQFGLVVYFVLLFCVVRAGLIQKLQYRPHINTLRQYSEHLPGTALLRWIANEYEESTEGNKKDLARKSLWVGAANIALYIEGVLLSTAALLTLL